MVNWVCCQRNQRARQGCVLKATRWRAPKFQGALRRSVKSQFPPDLESGASPSSPELINLELNRGLLRARFCQSKPDLATIEDLRKAKAAYDRASLMLSRQKAFRRWQRRWLEQKLCPLERC